MPFHFNYEQKYPYTDFDKINLDWILELATQLKEAAENGDFDGAPGEPGTATNGIIFLDNTNTFADIGGAISDGMLPVYKTFYNSTVPILYYCYEYYSSYATFIGFHGNKRFLLTWHVDNTKSLANTEWATIASPDFTGNPTVPTPAVTDSSTRIANTAFVQTAVSTAVQAAIEQLVIAPFSESFKQALLQMAQKVAYIDGNGQTYYQALYDALYPPINVDNIVAVWSPPVGYVVYTTTPVDTLKSYLTVTATYDDQTTAVLNSDEYILSGTLTAGTSVITVSYANATTTFNVTVVQNELDFITAVFTQGTAVIYDDFALSDLVQYLVVTATYTNLNTVYVDYPDYVLSGILTEGTSTITVSYGGKTTTFSVVVSSPLYSFDDMTATGTYQSYTISSGNHFRVSGIRRNYESDWQFDVGSSPGSTTDRNNWNTPMFSITNGANLELRLKNVSITSNKTGYFNFLVNRYEAVDGSNLAVGFRQASGNGVSYTNGTTTYDLLTANAVSPISGTAHYFGFYIYNSSSTSQDYVAEFDVELYVDGVRYV